MRLSIIIIVAALLSLSACGSLGYHEVREGETLYSIGWTYGYDVRTLAKWNGIPPPYVIQPGQVLRVAPMPEEAGTAPAPADQASAAPPAAAPAGAPAGGGAPAAAQPAAAAPPAAPPGAGTLHWAWPAQGRLVARFATGRPAGKGVDIAGREGEPVRAAAAGRVVYSGSGLIGYGNLVIIKHDDHFLSAYAYNRRLFVKEGDSVAMGDEIAEMGGPTPRQPKLHFEIRRDGDPVDPLDYLPGGGSLR